MKKTILLLTTLATVCQSMGEVVYAIDRTIETEETIVSADKPRTGTSEDDKVSEEILEAEGISEDRSSEAKLISSEISETASESVVETGDKTAEPNEKELKVAFDQEKYENITLDVRLKNGTVYAWNNPYNYLGYKNIGKAESVAEVGKDYKITRQAKTKNGIYYEVSKNVWISKSAFDHLDKPAYTTINSDVRLKNGTVYAWSEPYNYSGYKNIGKAESVAEVGKDYKVTRRAKTKNGIYYEVSKNVWISKSAFDHLDKPAYTTINSDVRLKNGTVYAWSEPYNYSGYKNIGKAESAVEVGKDYKLTRQAKTKNGIYYEVSKNVWISKSAFHQLDKPAYSTVNISAKLLKGTLHSWSAPYNYAGYKNIGQSGKVAKVNKVYKITRQAKTSNGIYYEVSKNVWIHRSGFSTTSEKIKKVQDLLNKKYNSSNYGIYVKSLSGGETAGINQNTSFVAASTGKLPAIYYTQKMINEGKINKNAMFQNKVAINNMALSYSPWGAGILQGQSWGSYHSIDKILNWTIKYSDNQGANFLGYYGCGQFSPTMRNEITRIIGRNWNSPFKVSAKENGKLMEAINKQGGNAVKYFQNTTYDNERIPKYLPVKVGHKIGDLEGYTHDVAIVYGKEPYILSVMTKNYIGKEKIAVMSKEIYNILK